MITSFKTYKLSKEKGFNWETHRYYEHALTEQIDEETGTTSGPFGWKLGETNLQSGYYVNGRNELSNKSRYICSAPTQTQLQRWIRKEHYIEVYVIPYFRSAPKKPQYIVYIDNKSFYNIFDTYEEAMERGLLFALKKIKKY